MISVIRGSVDEPDDIVQLGSGATQGTMHTLYLVSVWLHILAATAWIGGMFFLVLVVVPWLRQGSHRLDASALLRGTGERFRSVGWVCFAILLATGTLNLWLRGVRLADFWNPEWLSSPFARTLLGKLAVFLVVLLLSAWHDFYIGPRAIRAMAHDPEAAESRALRRQASLIGRTNAVLALLLVAAGVMLVRGSPWW